MAESQATLISRATALVRAVGRQGIAFTASWGRAGLMLGAALWGRPEPRKNGPILLQQLYVVGVQSLPIIVLAALFIGMVLGFQGYNVLVDFGAEQSLGPLVGLSLVRELAPVVTGLLFAGRAGSALTAEIGLMKATDQLSGLEMMAVDPVRRVVAPRLWAGVIAMPLLAQLFAVVGIWGGHLVGVRWLGVDAGSYWSALQSTVEWGDDIMNGLIKSIAFAIAVTWTALFQGYDATPTSYGVSQATTRCVVYASLMVLALDFLLTMLMFGQG